MWKRLTQQEIYHKTITINRGLKLALRRGGTLLVLGSIFLISCFFPPFACSSNYREILLGFYTQELVAHGAMLFAASAATFRFITGLIDKTNKRFWSSTIFLFFSGILLGLTIFLGFRLLYYGALTNGVTYFPKSPTEYESYGEYANDVLNYTEKSKAIPENLFKTIRGGVLDLNPFSILPVSVYIGYAVAYLIFYAFGNHSLNRNRAFFLLVFFVLPAMIGFIGVFCDLSSKIDCKLIFVSFLWYIGLIFVSFPCFVSKSDR